MPGDHFTRAEPAFEEIEKMHGVLDKDAAAFRAIPEPMIRPEPFVARVVFKPAVEAFAEHLGVDEPPHAVEDRVVTLHEIRDAEPVAGPGESDQFIRLGDREREGLLAEDVLAREERGARLRVVEKGRRGNVDEIDFGIGQEHLHRHEIGHAEAPRHGQRRFAMGARDGHEAHARRLKKLLEGEKSEAAGSDHADAECFRMHGCDGQGEG